MSLFYETIDLNLKPFLIVKKKSPTFTKIIKRKKKPFNQIKEKIKLNKTRCVFRNALLNKQKQLMSFLSCDVYFLYIKFKKSIEDDSIAYFLHAKRDSFSFKRQNFQGFFYYNLI